MAEENTHDEASSRDPAKAPALPLDHSKIQAERRVATERLLARLKAIDATQDAQTPRAYASRYIREQEPVILRLLDAGVGADEILADLAMSSPSIPKIDLRHAIAQLRDRRRKQTGTSTITTGRVHGQTQPSQPSGAATAPQPAHNGRPVSSRRPDESDEDYRLRKALEGSDDRRQFIGEH